MCLGDKWVEGDDGLARVCPCVARRATFNAKRRLRANGWVVGTSLSFQAPPLNLISADAKRMIERYRDDLASGTEQSLWITGAAGSGKSALSAYLIQQFGADLEGGRLGDLMSQLRWLAVNHADNFARRQQRYREAPLLVIEDGRMVRRGRSAHLAPQLTIGAWGRSTTATLTAPVISV